MVSAAKEGTMGHRAWVPAANYQGKASKGLGLRAESLGASWWPGRRWEERGLEG